MTDLSSNSPSITPRLVVDRGLDAIEFYRSVFDATELDRYAAPDGSLIHATLSIGSSTISVTEASSHNDHQTPLDLGGSPLLLTLMCGDPDATAKKALEKGSELVIPIEDRYYGFREGRLKDPFGHLWILSKQIQELADADIQAAVDKNET